MTSQHALELLTSPAAQEALGEDVCADLLRLVQRRDQRADELVIARADFESELAKMKGALTEHRNAATIASAQAEDFRLRAESSEAGHIQALGQVHALKRKLASVGAPQDSTPPRKEKRMTPAESYPIQSQYVHREGETALLVVEIKVDDVVETWTTELDPRE